MCSAGSRIHISLITDALSSLSESFFPLQIVLFAPPSWTCTAVDEIWECLGVQGGNATLFRIVAVNKKKKISHLLHLYQLHLHKEQSSRAPHGKSTWEKVIGDCAGGSRADLCCPYSCRHKIKKGFCITYFSFAVWVYRFGNHKRRTFNAKLGNWIKPPLDIYRCSGWSRSIPQQN